MGRITLLMYSVDIAVVEIYPKLKNLYRRNRQMKGHTDRRTDGCMDGCIEIDGWTNG